VQVGDGTMASVESAEHAELDYGRLCYLLAAPGAHAALELERVEEEARRRAGARTRSQGLRDLSISILGATGLPLDTYEKLDAGTRISRRDDHGVDESLAALGLTGAVHPSVDNKQSSSAEYVLTSASTEKLVADMLDRDCAPGTLGGWLQSNGSRVERVAVAVFGRALVALESKLGLEGPTAHALGRALDSAIHPAALLHASAYMPLSMQMSTTM